MGVGPGRQGYVPYRAPPFQASHLPREARERSRVISRPPVPVNADETVVTSN